MQRTGFPNVSIKLYQDYEAFLNHRFIELGATFVTMTLRDSIRGVNEGLLQFYDNKAMHTKLNGREIIQISLSTANTDEVFNRIYGISHSNVTIDQKSDNILTFQLKSYHETLNLKFSRALTNNAVNNVTSMIDAIYKEVPLWKPTIKGDNVVIPRCPWVSTINDYMDFVRAYGQSVETESFVYCWEDFDGITIAGYDTILKNEPIPAIICEPRLMGQFIDMSPNLMVFNFEWQTKSNAKVKNSFSNVTYTTIDFVTKQYNKIVVGNGDNIAHFAHGGAYGNLTYKNAFLEGSKLATIEQYDSYATAVCHGNFSLRPGMVIRFFDEKQQARNDFIVDEVVHEISREQSLTHLYMIGNSEELQEVKFEGKI